MNKMIYITAFLFVFPDLTAFLFFIAGCVIAWDVTKKVNYEDNRNSSGQR